MWTSLRTNRIQIGRIVGAQGIQGELKILALTDYPERFQSMDILRIFRKDGMLQAELTLVSVRFLDNKGLVVVETGEVKNRNDAEALIGGYVEVLPEERYLLEEGAFWIDDLLGMAVMDHSTDTPLGTLVDVLPAGENDLYIVRDENNDDHYIPAVKEFIVRVDLDKREIWISLIEGLWEL